MIIVTLEVTNHVNTSRMKLEDAAQATELMGRIERYSAHRSFLDTLDPARLSEAIALLPKEVHAIFVAEGNRNPELTLADKFMEFLKGKCQEKIEMAKFAIEAI